MICQKKSVFEVKLNYLPLIHAVVNDEVDYLHPSLF